MMKDFSSDEEVEQHQNQQSLDLTPFPPKTRVENIDSLLNSNTSFLCMRVLDEPARKKPGRKPKAMANDERHELPPVMDKAEERKLKNRIAADESRRRLRERVLHLEIYSNRLKAENETLSRFIHEMEIDLNLKPQMPPPQTIPTQMPHPIPHVMHLQPPLHPMLPTPISTPVNTPLEN
jgi:Rad3-related DNA helicase